MVLPYFEGAESKSAACQTLSFHFIPQIGENKMAAKVTSLLIFSLLVQLEIQILGQL